MGQFHIAREWRALEEADMPVVQLVKEVLPGQGCQFGGGDVEAQPQTFALLEGGVQAAAVAAVDPPLENEVEKDKNYAVVITTNGGLWRYKIGDTVRFTSINPYRIKVSGRTKHHINVFGEELIIENAEDALKEVCRETNAEIVDFTAAPIFMQGKEKGAHEWLIEFKTLPEDIDVFNDKLDKALQMLNSDYEAKRHKNLTLEKPEINVVPEGTFYEWMKRKGKIGGQNKIPRLSNDRKYLDELLEML